MEQSAAATSAPAKRQLDFTALHGGGDDGASPPEAAELEKPQSHSQQPPPPPPQSANFTPRRPLKPESPKSRPRTIAEVKDGTPKKPKQCNCKHSKCLKLYCECFASGVYCDGCNCVNCCNNIENEGPRREAVESTLERNPNAFRPKIASSPQSIKDSRKAGDLLLLVKHNKGCHCKKSGCLKKYCECFQADILCSENCKCIDCKNFEGSEEKQALFQWHRGNNNVYLQQAANAAVTGAIGSSGYGSLPISKKRKNQEHLVSPTATRDFHKVAQFQQDNHNNASRPSIPFSSTPNANPNNTSTLGHSKLTYRSLLADIIQPHDLKELCSVLVVVSQEAAKALADQKDSAERRVEDGTETSIASSAQEKSDKQKEADDEKSVTEACLKENQAVKIRPDEFSSDGADLPKGRPMSPSTLALMCDEQDMGQVCNTQWQLPNGQGMTEVYAEQERIVLTKFRDCLARLVTVGEIKETNCSTLARSEPRSEPDPINNGTSSAKIETDNQHHPDSNGVANKGVANHIGHLTVMPNAVTNNPGHLKTGI